MTCPECKKPFKPTGYNQKYCSLKCRRKVEDRKKTERNRAIPKEPRLCKFCNNSFTPKTYKIKYCSEGCRKKAFRKQQDASRKHIITKTTNIQTLCTCPKCEKSHLVDGRVDRARRIYCAECELTVNRYLRYAG